MKQQLIVLVSGREPTVEDQRLLTFAAFMGVSTKTVSIQDGPAFMERLIGEIDSKTCSLAMSAETLAQMASASVSELQKAVDEYPTELLVYGCTGSAEQDSALSALTAGTVSGIRQSGESAERFALPREAITLSGQLAGQSFSGGSEELLSTFELQDRAPAVEVIMEANERPMFVRICRGSSQVFLLTGPMPDVDKPLSREQGLERHYHSLVPPLIFFRHSFRESCWHGPESTARLIIDDPLLSDRYGFLDFNVLMNSMRRSRYGTSIAFIPWNCWRTSRMNATRLLGENSLLSICIHGCDHTNREFEAQDKSHLDEKASLAMRRMESQRKRAGAAFDPVMVFPQGLFSRAALAALRANNYLAAVNSTCFPTDNGPDDLRVRDLLRPAVTRYDGFPIFQRHYPVRLFDFAFDLFVGKPALIVEHHEYFRGGCGALEEFVAGLYKLDPNLTWPSLETQLTRSCLKKSLPNGSIEVQFFTRIFQLVSGEGGSDRFLLCKHEPKPEAVESVLVNGTSVPFWFDKDFLKLEIQADPGQTRNIEIVDRPQPHEQSGGFGIVHNTRVLLRRGLSEFRDNTLVRHDGLLKAAKGIARALKVTGDA